jgi:hypothetical protein
MAIDRQRRRLGWMAASMFLLFVVAGSAAYTREERVRYAALPLAAALMSVGRLFWLQGNLVWARQHFSLFAWRSRMFEYSGRKVLPFVWAFRMFGAVLALLGVGVAWLWLARPPG